MAKNMESYSVSDCDNMLECKCCEEAYEKGRADGYSKAENDYFKNHEEILKQQFDNGENYGYYKAIDEVLKEIDDIEFVGETKDLLACANATKNYIRSEIEQLKEKKEC